MRSIPEKTLEHWTSIYLSNRFPNGALWWPTSGEDVRVDLRRLAATGSGTTLALELKTTEAVKNRHELEVDTRQLERYLKPPLPIYYVFPLPHWTGPLSSRPGSMPAAPSATDPAPPEWWRQRIGSQWFGKWLYVMSAKSVSEALPAGWHNQKRATLFSLDCRHSVGQRPPWTKLFARRPAASPRLWRPFWLDVTRGEPRDGVLWRTVTDKRERPHVLVLSGDEQPRHPGELHDLSASADQPQVGLTQPVVVEDGTERVVLHIPNSDLS